MKGRDPLHAIQLIHELGLYSSIFWTPVTVLESFSSPPKDPLQGLVAATTLHSLTTAPSPLPPIHPLLAQHFTLHPSTKPRLFLASVLTPFKDITYPDAKGKTHPAVEAVLRDGCKLGNQSSYLSGIPTLFTAANLLKNPTLEVERFKHRPERVVTGKSHPKNEHVLHCLTNFSQGYYYGINPCTIPTWVQLGLSPPCSLWYKSYSRCGGHQRSTIVGKLPFLENCRLSNDSQLRRLKNASRYTTALFRVSRNLTS